MSSTVMAAEIGRLRKKLSALQAKVVEIEREAACADTIASELMSEIAQTESCLQEVIETQQCMENSLEEFQKVQDWKADQTEELWKEAMAVRQRLVLLFNKEAKFEARISQLEEEVKALKEAYCNTSQLQPVAKKMPAKQQVMFGPPPKKAKAETKAASRTRILVVKSKASTPASSRCEPSS